MKENFLKNKKIAILGMGRSGISTYKYLEKEGFYVEIFDDNKCVLEKYKTTGFNIKPVKDWDFKNLDCIITSPGIPLYYPKPHIMAILAEKYNVKILTDIELFQYFNPEYTYIGVTGTNGKSSVANLLHSMFTLSGKNCIVGGNIGIPVFDLPKQIKNTICVLELSSYQLSFNLNLHFHCALFLNINSNHDNYHGGFLNYMNAKIQIFKNQSKKDIAIINLDEEYCKELLPKLKNIKLFTVSLISNNSADIKIINNCVFHNNQNIIDLSLIKSIKGEVLKMLAVFGYAVAYNFNISNEVFIKSLTEFKGLNHRQYFIGKINNVKFINDSKATTPNAAAAALANFDNIYWLLGGIRKSGNLNVCKPYFNKVKKVFIFGKDRDSFEEEIKNNNLQYSTFKTLKEAIFAATNEAFLNKEKEGVVLLSPVGTSLDEFKNFEERGDFFINQVNCIKSKQKGS